MTAIVGILCRNGVVLGSDSSATFSDGRIGTIEQPTEKIEVCGGQFIIAGTGAVGYGQRFSNIVKQICGGNILSGKSEFDIARLLTANTINELRSTFAQVGQYGALVAFPVGTQYHLCEFAIPDFQPEFKTKKMWYVSMGSSQGITDPFLAFMREIYWSDGPPELQDGIFAATWTLEHAIAVNPGGVNGPVRIAVLAKGQQGEFEARVLDESELDEHRQNIDDAKQRLRDFRLNHQDIDSEELPDPPKLK